MSGSKAYHRCPLKRGRIIGLYFGFLPEKIQPCEATGPSCTDADQLVLGLPIPALSLLAFALIGALSAISLREASA